MTPLLPSDLLRFVIAADPQLAPDGRTVIFRRTAFDAERDASGGSLWRAAGGIVETFTAGMNDRLHASRPTDRASPSCAMSRTSRGFTRSRSVAVRRRSRSA